MAQAWGGSLWDVTGSVSCVCSQEVCEGAVARARELERVLQTGQRLAELLTSKWPSVPSLSWTATSGKKC